MNVFSRWFFRFVRDVAIVAVFATAIFVIVLYFNSNARHLVFRSVVEAPSGAFFYVIRRDMISRRFDSASARLQQQLNLITRIRAAKSSMLPGLIDNTRYVADQAAVPGDWDALRPFLYNLVAAADDVHLAHLWYGTSLTHDDPMMALDHLARAADLSGPHPAPYRVAIQTAFRNNMSAELQDWCRRYREEEFGGLRTYHYNNRFLETGIRRMAVRVELEDREIRYFGHRGLALGDTRTYEFAFDEPLTIDRLALDLGIVPGITVDVRAITVRMATGNQTIGPDAFSVFPRRGFTVDTVHVTTSRDGETLEFAFPGGRLEDVHALALEIATDRADLASASVCQGALGE